MVLTDKILAETFLPMLPRYVLPNHVTVFRFVLIPIVLVLLYFDYRLLGLLFFALAAFSDAVDGALARTRHQITEWGTLYDPLADKLLVSSVAALVVTRVFGWRLALAIIGMEFLIILGALYYRRRSGKVISAHPAAKLKMFCQSCGLICLFLYLLWPVPGLLLASYYLLLAAVVLAVISFFIYQSI